MIRLRLVAYKTDYNSTTIPCKAINFSQCVALLKMKIPKEHQLICSECSQVMDMRDLSQVFAHEPCDGNQKDYSKIEQLSSGGSQKIGDSFYWDKDKNPIHLN